jgi:hypothetical protein
MTKKKRSTTKSRNLKKQSASTRHVLFEDYLHKELQNPKMAVLYLTAALEDEDPRTFLTALKDVCAAHGIKESSIPKSKKKLSLLVNQPGTISVDRTSAKK